MDHITRKQWEIIYNNTNEAIIFFGNNGIVEIINPAAEQMTGYALGEAVGKSIYDIFKITDFEKLEEKPDTSAMEQSYDKNAFLETVLSSKDGTKRWISYSLTQVPAEGEEGEKMVIFARDIDNAKKVEQMRSDFISIASHELRTPLTVISGYLSLLLAGKMGKMTEQQSNFVHQIYEDTESLSSLVEDLLDVSRLDSGKFKLHKGEVSLNDLIKQTIHALLDKAMSRDISIVYDDIKNAPLFYGDRAKIRQVLTNLIDNAIKYTGPGGKVHVSLNISPEQFEIIVQDTGYGIDQKDLPHIFERFYRSESKLLDRVAGAGLGLYISREIVLMHGGTITVNSIFEKGTTFIITLPRDSIFESSHSQKEETKVPNIISQFFGNFLQNKRRRGLSL